MITLEFMDLDEMMMFVNRLASHADRGDTITPAPVQTFAPVLTTSKPVKMPTPPPAPSAQAAMSVQGLAYTASTQSAPAPTAPVSGVPISTPGYTPDDLARAAMTLMDSGRQQELIGLLQNFGVSSLPDLRPDQYGAFATALRGMGAQI